MEEILNAYKFTAEKYIEDDGSVTLSLNGIDLVENGEDEQKAKIALGKAIFEYSAELFRSYAFYSHSPNRKGHIPYIFKALLMDSPERIGESILITTYKK